MPSLGDYDLAVLQTVLSAQSPRTLLSYGGSEDLWNDATAYAAHMTPQGLAAINVSTGVASFPGGNNDYFITGSTPSWATGFSTAIDVLPAAGWAGYGISIVTLIKVNTGDLASRTLIHWQNNGDETRWMVRFDAGGQMQVWRQQGDDTNPEGIDPIPPGPYTLDLDVQIDFSQFHTRTGGPYAGDQNDLDFGYVPVTRSPDGVCMMYSVTSVTQFYINRGGAEGVHDLVPLYNDFYDPVSGTDGSLLRGAINAVEAWADIYVPDPDFAGMIILDIERPPRWYFMSGGDQTDWTNDTFDNAGETEYNDFFQLVVERMVAEIRRVRPNATIGWFDLPYVYETAAGYTADVKLEHDRMHWLWTLLDVLNPSAAYFTAVGDAGADDWAVTGHVTPAWNTARLAEGINETQRILTDASLSRPIYVYAWCRYNRVGIPAIHETAIIEDDFQIILDECVDAGVEGVIFWDSFGADQAATDALVTIYETFLPNVFIPVFEATGMATDQNNPRHPEKFLTVPVDFRTHLEDNTWHLLHLSWSPSTFAVAVDGDTLYSREVDSVHNFTSPDVAISVGALGSTGIAGDFTQKSFKGSLAMFTVFNHGFSTGTMRWLYEQARPSTLIDNDERALAASRGGRVTQLMGRI